MVNPHDPCPSRPPSPRDFPPRVSLEGMTPEIDGGRFPIKRIVGDEVVVAAAADIFADGHAQLNAEVRYRRICPGCVEEPRHPAWCAAPMRDVGNDRWVGRFRVEALGWYEYCVAGWIDEFAMWREHLATLDAVGAIDEGDLKDGARLLRHAAGRAAARAAELTEPARMLGCVSVAPSRAPRTTCTRRNSSTGSGIGTVRVTSRRSSPASTDTGDRDQAWQTIDRIALSARQPAGDTPRPTQLSRPTIVGSTPLAPGPRDRRHQVVNHA